MGQFLRVNGDYNIQAGEGSKIILDTGENVGEVVVTGDLRVTGDTLFVQTTDLQIEDRIITVNFGETGAGVSAGTAGLEVDRGSLSNVSFLWNENSENWELRQTDFNVLLNETPYTNSKILVKEILTDPQTDGGDLILIGTGSGVVKVGNRGSIAPYESLVTDEDDIPNKKYVDDAIINNPTFQVARDDSRLIVFDENNNLPGSFFVENQIADITEPPTESQIAVIVQNSVISRFYRNRVELGDLVIFNESPTDPAEDDIADAVVIQTLNSSANIKLETSDTGKVEITYALQLNNDGLEPSVVRDSTVLYGGDLGPGQTGMYHYTYNGSVNSSVRGELINKNRALLYSMIF
jgi:hypothetical protein